MTRDLIELFRWRNDKLRRCRDISRLLAAVNCGHRPSNDAIQAIAAWSARKTIANLDLKQAKAELASEVFRRPAGGATPAADA